MDISKKFESQSDIILFEGNCLDFYKQIPDNQIQIVVTSPPYNIGKEYEDRQDIASYLEFQRKVISESVRVLTDSGSLCWQIGNYVDNGEIFPLDILLYPIFKDVGLKLRNRIIWHYGHGLHAKKKFSGRYETILWFTKTDDYVFNLDSVRVPQKYPNKKHYKGAKIGELSGNPLGKNPSDVWEIPNVKSNHIEKTEHPAQFPVELIERLVLALSNENDWVLDPFVGSGTSYIAGAIHNRKVAGSDIHSKYLNIAHQRIIDGLDGKLKIRPMERLVGENTPPKTIKLK